MREQRARGRGEGGGGRIDIAEREGRRWSQNEGAGYERERGTEERGINGDAGRARETD